MCGYLLLVLEASDGLPEPLHDLVVGLAVEVAGVLGLAYPVVHVDVGQAVQQQLQLLEVKDGQQGLGHHVVEPLRWRWRRGTVKRQGRHRMMSNQSQLRATRW